MQDLMLFLANATPIEIILEKLETSIMDYKSNPTKDNKDRIGAICALFTTKELIDDRGGDVFGVMKDFNEKCKIMDMMDMKNNPS